MICIDDRCIYRESERDWDKDLAEDVKGECEEKYGKVEFIKIERESQVSIQELEVLMKLKVRYTGRDLRQVRLY